MCNKPRGVVTNYTRERVEYSRADYEADRAARRNLRELVYEVILLWSIPGCLRTSLVWLVPTNFLVREYYFDTPVTSEASESEDGEENTWADLLSRWGSLGESTADTDTV
eukprot:GHVU01130137.1.p1 GENE.GHVU01130137.1~~GHVU01130137.1.p1  ORF type:complete len:110 (-),score=6.40 GHVU01130137.1:750-1079(-)